MSATENGAIKLELGLNNAHLGNRQAQLDSSVRRPFREAAVPLDRRKVLTLLGTGAASSLLRSSPLVRPSTTQRIRAIAFDGFTTFDPRPVAARAEQLFPGRGTDLNNAWRTRQFEYTWLRTLTARYSDFWHVTEEALVFAGKLLNLGMTVEKRKQLMQAFLNIKAWPDALPALKLLQVSGIRMALLSNFTAAMLDAAVHNSNLQGIFESHLSTDTVRAYKPDPRAYQMGVDALGLRREEIAFAAFSGWDVAGAKAFGYPTFWVNRLNLPLEELGLAPDESGTTLHDLVEFVT